MEKFPLDATVDGWFWKHCDRRVKNNSQVKKDFSVIYLPVFQASRYKVFNVRCQQGIPTNSHQTIINFPVNLSDYAADLVGFLT